MMLSPDLLIKVTINILMEKVIECNSALNAMEKWDEKQKTSAIVLSKKLIETYEKRIEVLQEVIKKCEPQSNNIKQP